ncbi:MAG: 4-hydroxy-3-methylbut-2-enyl diphosphate reductase, partial [Bacilli bacterium]|nr:4-hydroxy-3-methylbut-2-enyl diphosphate reductase [Bacilli bacterium]
MEIIVGKNSGFCNGVKYTVKMACEELEKFSPIFCLGEIVHNKDVIKSLEDKGMITVNDISDIPNNAKVIIRAHGESLEVYEK